MEPQLSNILKCHTIVVMANAWLQKRNQFLVFPLLRKQGELAMYNDDINNIIICYSEIEASEAELFEMTNNKDYGNGMTEQKQGLLSVSSNDG